MMQTDSRNGDPIPAAETRQTPGRAPGRHIAQFRSDHHASASRRCADAARAFTREESGAVVAFTLMALVLFLTIAGLGIDTMRQEMERTRLQATLDRAVLAGAGQATEFEPRTVVEDFFAKSGMSEFLSAEADGDIVTTLNSAKVSAQASMTMDTYLMQLSGVDTLSAGGASTAEMRIPKLEVVMVLDVSGSMNSNNKIGNLKVAAKQFVSTILNNSEPGNTVITLVPFSWAVTPPQTIYETLAVDEEHQYSTCLAFREQDYSHATLTSGASALSGGVPVNQMIYTSVYGDFDNLNSSWRSCYTDEYMQILPYSSNEAQLHAKIDSFQADGNTSAHEGMNWGAALIDPSFRQVSAQLISANEMDPALSAVPADYTEPETLKVIVLMGDGANTTSFFFDRSSPRYRGPNSDLFRVTYQEQEFEFGFTIFNPHRRYFDPSVEQYCSQSWFECVYSPTGDELSAHYLRDPGSDNYYNIEEEEWIDEDDFEDLEDTLAGFISSEQLDWEVAWGRMSPRFYGEITGDWRPWNDYVGSERINGSEKDQRMQAVCGATKNQGAIVYSIGFEISRGGNAERQLQDCASSTGHYFRAEGVSITDAFSAIAGNVQNLRLTQ